MFSQRLEEFCGGHCVFANDGKKRNSYSSTRWCDCNRRNGKKGKKKGLRKAWSALLLPVSPRWKAKHAPEKQRLLRMDFATYRHAFLDIPAQIVRTGRKIVYRLLAWNPWQESFFRLVDHLRTLQYG